MTPNSSLSNWPDPVGANARRSVLASDLVIEGDVTSDGPVDVYGKVLGSVRAPEVVIAAAGRVEGSVSAQDMSVLGFVSGSVTARQLHLSPSAVVLADVRYERMSVETGARLEGAVWR